MTNNERFNAMLNSCHNPRAIFNALQALAPAHTKGELLDAIMELTEDECAEALTALKSKGVITHEDHD